MNIQNMVRFALLLCLIFSTDTGLSIAQDNVAVDESATLTLEQLKAEGASKSRYRQQNEAASAVKETQTKDTTAEFEQLIKPMLKEACVQCHGPDHVEGNIRIDTLNPDLVDGPDSHWWLEVQAVLSNGEMPPPDAKSLKDTDRAKVVEWLADEIQRASKVRRATGGHSSFRRLTRYEYNYALQDLLGVKWNFAKDLPPESHSDDGFQNSSELLHMSVGQLESYRQIALTALRRVTVRGERPPVIHWGVSMEEAADREWPKQQEQLAKAKEQYKDDPVKLQEEVDRLTASFKQPHDRPYYRELSSGDTARAARRGITEKKMFGGVCFLLNGNMLVAVWNDSLIARLGVEQAEIALTEPDVREMDLTGRPMKGWIIVEPDGIDSDQQLTRWIDLSLTFVRTLPAK